MIESILGVTIGAYVGLYLISFAIYINEFLIDIKRFKATKFFEYVIVSFVLIGSIVPILNSFYAYKIMKYKGNE